MNLAVILAAFVIIFPAELPDKSTIAAVILGSKYRPVYVFAGVATALLAQVAIAVAAGQVLGLLSHRILELVVGLLFLLGAWLVLRGHGGEPEEVQREVAALPQEPSFWRVAATSFSIVFIAEFGDLTQIATANLAAKFHDPLSVGIGSTLALWAVAGLGVWGGKNVLRVLPMKWFTRVAAAILVIFAIASLVAAAR